MSEVHFTDIEKRAALPVQERAAETARTTGDAGRRQRSERVRAWIPALLWLAVIAIESTDWLSSKHTGSLLFPIFHWLFGISPEQFAPIHAITRKTGHVVGYGMLSFLLFRAWRRTIEVVGDPRWAMVWARTALLMTALVASLDEWHQSFIPSRTGTFHDVVLDTAAGLAAQVLVYSFLVRRNRVGSAAA